MNQHTGGASWPLILILSYFKLAYSQKSERARLIAKLSEDLARDTTTSETQPSTLEELLRVAKPWKGLSQPLSQQEDEEVSEFMDWRQQREQDRELDTQRDARMSEIWEG